MKNKSFFKNFVMILALAAFLLPFAVKAENPANDQAVKFYISPLKLEMPVGPGQTLTKEITVLNQYSNQLHLKAYVMDYEIKKDNTFEFFPPGYETYSCAEWISLSDSDFILEGNQEKKVKITLNVPQKTEPAGHYSVVFFESVGKPLGENTTGVITQGRIGTLVLQFVPGEANKSGKIKEFDIPKYFWSTPKFFFFGGEQPVPWKMAFKNDGNTHINLESKIEFLDFRGKSVYSTDPQRITILPKTERELKGTWQNAPTFGKFTAVLKTDYIDTEGNNQNESKTISFYIIPVRAILIALIIGFLVIIFIIISYKLGKRRSSRKDKEKTKGNIKCPNCKKLIDKNTTYCSYCGKKVRKAKAKK